MIRTAIIEDEPAVREEIIYLLRDQKDIELIGWADSVISAAELIEQSQPDLLLMDIQLADGTAFDVLKKLNPVPENIVFITAYNQFAIKAIKYGALDYLLKPVDQEELTETLNRYRSKRDKNPQWAQQLNLAQESLTTTNALPEHITLSSLNNVRVVAVADILYCKGDGPYTFFFLNNGKKELVSKPLKYYEELLPAPFFLRSHQSYLVNKNYVSGISRSEFLVLKNQEEIPVSSRRRNYIINLLSTNK